MTKVTAKLPLDPDALPAALALRPLGAGQLGSSGLFFKSNIALVLTPQEGGLS
jgi:hypothetical protein